MFDWQDVYFFTVLARTQSLSAAARELIGSRDFDYVIHGHSHHPRDEPFSGTRVINPGALGNTRWRRPSFAILDLATGDLSWVKL